MLYNTNFLESEKGRIYCSVKENGEIDYVSNIKFPIIGPKTIEDNKLLIFLSGIFSWCDEKYIFLIKDNEIKYLKLEKTKFNIRHLSHRDREEYDSVYINSLNLDFPDGFIPVYDFLNPIVK